MLLKKTRNKTQNSPDKPSRLTPAPSIPRPPVNAAPAAAAAAVVADPGTHSAAAAVMLAPPIPGGAPGGIPIPAVTAAVAAVCLVRSTGRYELAAADKPGAAETAGAEVPTPPPV